MKILALSILLFNASAFAHPTVNRRIASLNGSLNSAYRDTISNAIFMTSIKYKVPSKLMVAILRQESNFNNNAKNCRNNICHDFGIAQINKHTAKAYNFDLKKIMKDPIYSIDCMGRVLHDLKKQYAKKDKLWWTYYNAVTWEKRLNYYLAVNRYK